MGSCVSTMKNFILRTYLVSSWWELNPHMLPYLILSQTCLPISAQKDLASVHITILPFYISINYSFWHYNLTGKIFVSCTKYVSSSLTNVNFILFIIFLFIILRIIILIWIIIFLLFRIGVEPTLLLWKRSLLTF